MKKALIGYGGHAREVMCQMNQKLDCFVDDQFLDSNTLSLSKFDPNIYEVMICVSNPKSRYEIVNKLPKETKYFTFIHPTAQLMSNDITIGEGSFIGANSIITCNVKIGKHAILNRGNHIGHDCRIGDYFSAMPGSILSGNVTINDRFYIGTNSCIREKIKICDNVTIGLGSSVIKNIVEPGTYVGCPVLKIK